MLYTRVNISFLLPQTADLQGFHAVQNITISKKRFYWNFNHFVGTKWVNYEMIIFKATVRRCQF